MHIVGFIIRTYHGALSPERQLPFRLGDPNFVHISRPSYASYMLYPHYLPLFHVINSTLRGTHIVELLIRLFFSDLLSAPFT